MSQGLCRLPSRASLPSAESRFICGARARMAACTAEAAASEGSLGSRAACVGAVPRVGLTDRHLVVGEEESHIKSAVTESEFVEFSTSVPPIFPLGF